jgi:thiol-disulfide isomerase/thioredoxin
VKKFLLFSLVFSLLVFVLPACTSRQTSAAGTQEPVVVPASATVTPEWFDMELVDVQTNKTFTINDYAGKVVLLDTMAMWCPTCLLQAGQVQKLERTLGNPEDLISVSLDVDLNEDATSLKEYAVEYGLDWHLAVAPLLVARALGNLYTAQYLNPPLSPMMIIDRKGNVHHLEYGLKDAETLQKAVEPYLTE